MSEEIEVTTVQVLPLPTKVGTHLVSISQGYCMPDPASTKRVLAGPGTYTIIVHADGGITARREK